MPGRQQLNPTDIAVLDHLLDEAFAALDAGQDAQLRTLLDEAADVAPDDAEVLYLRGHLAWIDTGPDAARPLLEAAVIAEPTYADAHHALARVHEHLDGRDAMIEHDLRVLELDARGDARSGLGNREDLDLIERTARDVLARLPEEFRERISNVPVVLEARPSAGIVREGFDPRALGLFEGNDDHGQRVAELQLAPTRIVLFYANLLASFPEDEQLLEQIEITVLHELGHFFGLDEDEVAKLGLE